MKKILQFIFILLMTPGAAYFGSICYAHKNSDILICNLTHIIEAIDHKDKRTLIVGKNLKTNTEAPNPKTMVIAGLHSKHPTAKSDGIFALLYPETLTKIYEDDARIWLSAKPDPNGTSFIEIVFWKDAPTEAYYYRLFNHTNTPNISNYTFVGNCN